MNTVLTRRGTEGKAKAEGTAQDNFDCNRQMR